MQQCRDPRKSRTGVVADQRCSRARIRDRTVEYDHGCTCCRQFAPIARLRQERHRLTVSVRKRPDTLNERVGIAAKLTAKSNSEFPERNGHIATPEARVPLLPASLAWPYLPGGFGGAAAGAEAGAPAFGRETAELPGLACSCARMAGVMSIVGVE